MQALARCLAIAGCLLLVVFGLDAVIFRSGLYKKFVSPDSSAGSVQQMIRIERERRLSSNRRVLVLGNSQQAEGFSAKIAAKALAPEGIDIVNSGVPGLTMRDWFYIVRDLDPEATRYNVIAIPMTDYADWDYGDNIANRVQDLSFVIGSLRLTDLLSFSMSFPARADRWSAFRGGLFEGLTYREDIRDFLRAPRLRLAIMKDHRLHGTEWQDGYGGNENSLEGLTYDVYTEAIHFAPGTPPETERFVRDRLNTARHSTRGVHQRAFARRWLGAVADLYRRKDMRFVIFRMPQYPVHLELPAPNPLDPNSVVGEFRKDPRTIVIDEHEFDWLETPLYALDGLHLNTRGRIAFSEAFGKKLGQVLSGFQPKSN